MLPLSLLKAAQNHPMLVELKNGETYNGHLVNCDNWMNIQLREVICTSRDGDRFWKMPECFIRGSTIKYLRIPDEVIDMVKEEKVMPRGRGRGGMGDEEDNYDEANTVPRYTPNPRAPGHDKEVGGYIDVTKIRSNNSVNKRSSHILSQRESLTSMIITEEDDVSQMTARSLTLDTVPEAGSAPPSTNYLTIVRGEESPKEEPKKKTMEPVVYKPANTSRQHLPLHASMSLDSKSVLPPPVLPRPEGHKSSPPSSVRSDPSHRSSAPYGYNPNTRVYENTVPPLPPR